MTDRAPRVPGQQGDIWGCPTALACCSGWGVLWGGQHPCPVWGQVTSLCPVLLMGRHGAGPPVFSSCLSLPDPRQEAQPHATAPGAGPC